MPASKYANAAGYRQSKINIPERFGGLGNSRCQFRVLERTGRLGAIKLHAAHAEHGQHGHGQHDDAHPTEPLELLPVIKHRWKAQLIQARQYRGPRRGQSRRWPSKIGIRYSFMRRFFGRKQQGRGTETSQHDPEGRHYQEAVPQPQVTSLILANGKPQSAEPAKRIVASKAVDEGHGRAIRRSTTDTATGGSMVVLKIISSMTRVSAGLAAMRMMSAAANRDHAACQRFWLPETDTDLQTGARLPLFVAGP